MQPQRKHLPADERRAVIVDTVVELAAEQNPGDITTAAIASRMGLTQGALFRHFPSKDSILQAVMEWLAEHLLGRLDAATKDAATPLAALEAMFLAHVDFVVQHPGVPRLLFGELQRAEDSIAKQLVQTMIRRYGERLQRWLAAGIKQGELNPALDCNAAATLFIGSIQGLVMQSLLAGDVARIRRDAPGTFAIYRRGIGSTT